VLASLTSRIQDLLPATSLLHPFRPGDSPYVCRLQHVGYLTTRLLDNRIIDTEYQLHGSEPDIVSGFLQEIVPCGFTGLSWTPAWKGGPGLGFFAPCSIGVKLLLLRVSNHGSL
jgi:hypothetical protein